MRELSLFTGAGGGLLGTKLLGWKHCGYVEWNEYCQRVIAARIADGYLDNAPIFTDVREFAQSGAAEQYRGIADVVSAGFPCQPFSVAGKQAGADDERNMWPSTVEVIRIVQPRSVLLENVPGLISCGYLGTVLSDLAALGYVGRWGVLGACDAGAPHKRDRLWIVAHAEHSKRRTQRVACDGLAIQPDGVSQRQEGSSGLESGGKAVAAAGGDLAHATQQLRNGRDDHAGIGMGSKAVSESGNGCGAEIVAYANASGQQELHAAPIAGDSGSSSGAPAGWWLCDPGDAPESGVGRVVDGVAHRVDRLKATGNGQVSAVAALAWRLLA